MITIDHKKITERVKHLILKEKVSDYYVWKHAFIPNASFSMMINSKSNWKLEHLVNIAKLFQVSFNWLVFGDENCIKKEFLYEIKELREENLLLKEELSDYRIVKDIILKSKQSKHKKIKERG